jgi:hypothetical protein
MERLPFLMDQSVSFAFTVAPGNQALFKNLRQPG